MNSGYPMHEGRPGKGRGGRRNNSRRGVGARPDLPDFEQTGRHPGGHPQHHPGFPTGDPHSRGLDRSGPMGGRGRGRGRGGRVPRGDVRAAVLTLLGDEPMHGYQLMQAIAERSNGRWTPSPGAIYPVLSQLEDEALVTITTESGRKIAALTVEGREAATALAAQGRDPFTTAGHSDGPDLRGLMGSLADAVRQVARTGSIDQRQKAATLLEQTRRSLYLILADGPGQQAGEAEPGPGSDEDTGS